MKLVPLFDRVVLKQLVAEETTKSGIVLPGQAKEKPQQAEVIAVGPGGVVDGKEVTMQMLNQAQGDREILAKQLNISQQQMTYVTHSEAGEGLIFYGNVILPFIDRFPKDTELYRVMTTKPGEVSA